MRRQKTRIKITPKARFAQRLERKRAKEAKQYEDYLRDIQQMLDIHKTTLTFEAEAESGIYNDLQNEINQLKQPIQIPTIDE